MSFNVKITRRRSSAAANIARGLKNLVVGPMTVKVGIIEGKADSDVIDRAFFNEFGTNGGGWGGPIPERPFMRNGVRQTNATLKGKIPSMAKALLLGRAEKRQILSKMGIQGQQDMRDAIDAMTTPENAEATKKLKGSTHPLIDTGEMSRSISWEIDE